MTRDCRSIGTHARLYGLLKQALRMSFCQTIRKKSQKRKGVLLGVWYHDVVTSSTSIPCAGLHETDTLLFNGRDTVD